MFIVCKFLSIHIINLSTGWIRREYPKNEKRTWYACYERGNVLCKNMSFVWALRFQLFITHTSYHSTGHIRRYN